MGRLPQLALLIVLALIAVGAPPAASQGGARLHLPLVATPDLFVFVSDRDSGSSIVEAAPDGSARRTLSGPTTNDSAPALSPDGRQIAFFSTRDGRNALYVMASDGSGPRKLADCNICVRVQWAPDGRRLWLDDQRYVITEFGPSNRLVTSLLSLDGAPAQELPATCAALSRDGARCAYLAPSEGGWKIVVRSPPTAEPLIVASTMPLPMSLSWSPDGATLLYSTEAFRDYAVNVVGLDGRPPRKLAAGTAPQWSPAGDAVAFLEQGDTYGGHTLKVVGADGGGEATIATGAYALLGWSPDGAQLAYTEDFSLRQLSLIARGGQPQRVEGLTGVDAVVWSPDSARLAVAASPDGISSVYTIRRDGSELREVGSGSGPLWTPDGAALLMADMIRAPLRLYAQAPGAAATPIAYGELPALAPGGRRLAFVRGGKLFTIGTDGRGERPLAETLTVTARPAWSPDAVRIAVAAHMGGPDGIFLLGPEAGSPRLLALCGAALCGAPSWAPDGTTIYFGQKEIVSVAAQGGEPQSLGQATNFALSPDGASIAYVSGDIFVMGADGAGSRKLTECAGPFPYSASCSNLAWSADGRSLSFGRSGIIGGKASFSETQVVDAVSGAELLRQPWHWARWRGQELAYLYMVRFGHYALGSYDPSSYYVKLAMPPSFGSCCGAIPPGHGNAVDYAIAP
jgi:Tol biopolymer transport system component